MVFLDASMIYDSVWYEAAAYKLKKKIGLPVKSDVSNLLIPVQFAFQCSIYRRMHNTRLNVDADIGNGLPRIGS